MHTVGGSAACGSSRTLPFFSVSLSSAYPSERPVISRGFLSRPPRERRRRNCGSNQTSIQTEVRIHFSRGSSIAWLAPTPPCYSQLRTMTCRCRVQYHITTAGAVFGQLRLARLRFNASEFVANGSNAGCRRGIRPKGWIPIPSRPVEWGRVAGARCGMSHDCRLFGFGGYSFRQHQAQ